MAAGTGYVFNDAAPVVVDFARRDVAMGAPLKQVERRQQHCRRAATRQATARHPLMGMMMPVQ